MIDDALTDSLFCRVVRVHTGDEGGRDAGTSDVGQCENRGGDPDQRAYRQQRGRAHRRNIVKFEKARPRAQVRDQTGAQTGFGRPGKRTAVPVRRAGACVQVLVGRRLAVVRAGVQRLVHGIYQPGPVEPHGPHRNGHHFQVDQMLVFNTSVFRSVSGTKFD